MTQASSAAVTHPPRASFATLGRTRFAQAFRPVTRVWSSAVHQNRLIFPGQQTRGTDWARVTPPEGAKLLELPVGGGDRVTALFGKAILPEGAPRAAAPTVLFFYGNEMCLRHALAPFEFLRGLGFNVLVPEYLGYGMSTGRASESGCYATADAAYDYLLSREELDPAKFGVLGCSLGGAVAIDLASRRPVPRLGTLVTFTSIADIVRLSFPRLPASLLLRYRFESERKIRRVHCPVLIGHSTDDRRIPFSMADRLAAAASGTVRRLRITGADHSTTELLRIAGPQIAGALVEFFNAA